MIQSTFNKPHQHVLPNLHAKASCKQYYISFIGQSQYNIETLVWTADYQNIILKLYLSDSKEWLLDKNIFEFQKVIMDNYINFMTKYNNKKEKTKCNTETFKEYQMTA